MSVRLSTSDRDESCGDDGQWALIRSIAAMSSPTHYAYTIMERFADLWTAKSLGVPLPSATMAAYLRLLMDDCDIPLGTLQAVSYSLVTLARSGDSFDWSPLAVFLIDACAIIRARKDDAKRSPTTYQWLRMWAAVNAAERIIASSRPSGILDSLVTTVATLHGTVNVLASVTGSLPVAICDLLSRIAWIMCPPPELVFRPAVEKPVWENPVWAACIGGRVSSLLPDEPTPPPRSGRDKEAAVQLAPFQRRAPLIADLPRMSAEATIVAVPRKHARKG